MVQDSIAYLYYRCYQFYGGSQRSDQPVSFLIGLNGCLIINVVARLLSIDRWLIQGDLIAFIVIALGTPMVILSNRRFFHRKFDDFKGETVERRKRNGLLVILYII